MIAEAIAAVVELLTSLVRAGEDSQKQEEALMAAEERLARARARAKFGG
jgi:hypothetical protein